MRRRIKKLERTMEAEYEVLLCRECGERFKVKVDTDLHYIAHEWARSSGGESYQPSSATPDVFLIEAHEHGEGFAESLVYEATGEPWPEIADRARKRLEEASEAGDRGENPVDLSE